METDTVLSMGSESGNSLHSAKYTKCAGASQETRRTVNTNNHTRAIHWKTRKQEIIYEPGDVARDHSDHK